MAESDKTKPVDKTPAQQTAADKVVSEQKAAEDSLRQLFQHAKQSQPRPDSAGGERQETGKPADSPEKRMASAQQTAGDRLRADAKPDVKENPAEKAAQSQTAEKLLGEVAIDFSEAKDAGTGAAKAADTQAQAGDEAAARKKAESIADAIDKACNGGFLLGAGTDHQAVVKALEGTTEKERELIKQAYKDKNNGRSLEEEFADEMDQDSPEYAACMAALNRKDGSSGDAARLTVAIKDRAQWVFGRSDEAIEQDVIDTVSTMNASQIAKMKEEFMADPENQKKYPGGIEQAIKESDLSDDTKKAFEIFIKGNDKRSLDDLKQLIDIATGSGNLQLLEQTMRDTSAAVREEIAKDPEIDRKLERAFGSPVMDETTGELTYASTQDLEQARGYMADGHMRVSDSISNSTSWAGDNEEAIEAAIKNMPETERQSYLRGREMAETGKPPADYSQKDSQTYTRIQEAMKKAGDAHETARWDAMIEYPKGSLVETLSRHKGSIYDDSTDKVMKSIENMSAEDFERLKNNPRYLKQLRDTLATFADGDEFDAEGNFADSEMGKLSKMLHDMQNATSQEAAVAEGGRTLLERIDAKTGYVNDDEEGIYAELEKMTPAERKTLQTNPEEVAKLKEKLRATLDEGAELEQALGMVDNIVAGRKDAKGLIEKIHEQAQKMDTEESVVIRDFRQALKDDPQLLERIKNDPEYKERLTRALHEALDDNEFETYAKPLLENGHLDIALQMQLNQGTFDDDEVGAVKDMQFATAEEKEKILNDPAYRQQVMGYLSPEEQKVALNVLKQGKMLPEDEIEIQMLGAGTGEEEIKKALKDLKPEEREQVALAYYEKYGKDRGEDLRTALINEMGGKDKLDVLRTLEAPADARTEFNRRRNEYYDLQGMGEAWVDAAWDGTADDARARLNDYAAALSKATAAGKDLTPEERQKHSEALVAGLDQLAKSQGAVADAAADAIITVGAVAAAKFTGGVSLSLLAYTSAGAALLRVGAHSALNNRFETFSAEGATQFFAGAADGLFAVAGGTEIAKLMQLGKRAATESAEVAAKQLLRESTHLLAEGSEQGLKKVLTQGTTGIVSEALATGGNVGKEALEQFAQTLVKKELTGEAREQAVKQVAATLAQNLETAVAKESKEAFKQAFREIALNAAAGNAGATASAIPRAMLEFDPNHPERFFMMVGASAVIGTVAGGGMTAMIKGAGETISHVASRGSGDDAAARQLADATGVAHNADNAAVHTADNAPVSRVRESGTPLDETAPSAARTKPEVPSNNNADTAGETVLTREAAELPDGRASSVAGNELAGPDGESGLWHPERNWDKMPAAERKAIEEAIEGKLPKLADKSEQRAFAKRMLEVTQKWDENLAPKLREINSADRNRINKWEEYRKILQKLQDRDEYPAGHIDDPIYMEALLGHDKKSLKVFKEYMAATEKWQTLMPERERIQEQLAKRIQELQKSVDEFTDSAGMPRIQLGLSQHSDAAGGSYRAGAIDLNPVKVADSGNTADMLGTLYHELTHANQDATIINHLADELGIRTLADATPEQLADLKALYDLRVKPSPSTPEQRVPKTVYPEDYARQVLAKRDPAVIDLEGPNKQAGRFLTDDQALRAEGMADAFKINDPPGELYKQLQESYKIIDNRMKKYAPPNTEILMAKELGQEPKTGLYLRMFGEQGPSPEWQRLIKRAKSDQFDTVDKAKAKELIEARLKEINDARKTAYAAYMEGAHEKEAHYIGEQMRKTAKATGGTETKPEARPRKRVQEEAEPEVVYATGEEDDLDLAQLLDQLNRKAEAGAGASSTGDDLELDFTHSAGDAKPRNAGPADEDLDLDFTRWGDDPERGRMSDFGSAADEADDLPRAGRSPETFAPDATGSEFPRATAGGYHIQMGDDRIPINKNKITLGRATDADVNFGSYDRVSRNHAEIEFTSEGPVLANAKSGVRTKVNGKEITGPTPLKPGDRIQLADAPEFIFGRTAPEAVRPQGLSKYQIKLEGVEPFNIGKEKIILGRHPNSDLVIGDVQVSRQHAQIEFTENGPVITHLSETNKTYVNGQPITEPTALKPGDRIRIGSTEMVFGEKPPAAVADRLLPPRLEQESKFRPGSEVQVQVDGRAGEHAVIKMDDPFDPNNVIVRISGREADLGRLMELSHLPEARPVIIDGKTYLQANGKIYAITEMNGHKVAYQQKEFRSAAKSSLSDAPVKIEPPALPKPAKPADSRVLDEVPRAPGRPGAERLNGNATALNRPEAYEGVGISVNGKRLDIDPVNGLKLERQSLNPEDLLISRNQGTLKWDPQAQSFYIEDHSLNGINIRRPGETGFTNHKDQRVYIGPHDEIVVGQTVVKLDAPHFPQSRYTGAMRTTDVQAFFDGEPVSIKNGEIKLGLNHQSFGNQKSDVINKLVSREHANLRFDETSGNWILTDTTKARPKHQPDFQGTVMARAGEPNGTYVKHKDGSVTVLRGDQAGHESIVLKEGDRVHLGHEEGPELKLVFGQGTDLQDGRIQFKRPNMDTVLRRPDGSQEITAFSGGRRVEDLQGRIVETTDRRGATTRLSWDDKNQLSKITLSDGSTVTKEGGAWVRDVNGQKQNWWRGDIEVDPNDGALRYSDKGKPPKITVERLDGTREVIRPNGRVDYLDVSFSDEVGHMNKLWQNPDLFELPEERVRFKNLMNEFENRAREQGLSNEQKALTFRHVRRLLEAGDASMIPQNLRKDLAEQILNQAGSPRLISQGANNTCNVTTLERRLFTRNPDEAARLIADVATSGKYVSADGTIVDLSRVPGALNPDAESRMLLGRAYSADGSDLHIDGKRTYASQVFETAAVNIKYARNGSADKSPFGDVVLYQKSGLPGQEQEQLVRYYREFDGSLKKVVTGDSPHIATEELADVHNQILGKQERDFVFRSPESFSQPGVAKYSDAAYRAGGDLRVPENADEFQKMLLAKNPKDFPVVLLVHTGHPFFGQMGEGGAHVVNVTGIFEHPAGSGKYHLEILNQWGEKYNGTVAVNDAYNLMRSPKTIAVPKSAFRPRQNPAAAAEQQGFLRRLFS